MKINEAVLPDSQTTPVQESLLNDTFHVSLHTADQFRCILEFFDLFARRDTTPTWQTDAERRIKDKAARVHGFRQLNSAA